MYGQLSTRIEQLSVRIGKHGCSMCMLMKEVKDIESEANFSYHYGLIDNIERETLENKLYDLVQSTCSSTTGTKG